MNDENKLIYGFLSKDRVDAYWSRLLDMLTVQQQEFVWHYCDSTFTQEGAILGFKHAPAGCGVHHDYIGGLVHHLLGGFDIIDVLIDIVKLPRSTLDDIRAAWLYHDLHKAYYHFIQSQDGKLSYYSNHELSMMYTPNQKTFAMLDGSFGGPKLPLNKNIHHILNCSEGGWAENAPRQASVAAKFVYLVDEISVAQNRVEQGKLISIYKQDPSWFQGAP